MVLDHNASQRDSSIRTDGTRAKQGENQVKSEGKRRRRGENYQTGISLDFAVIGLTREVKPRKSFKRQKRIMTEGRANRHTTRKRQIRHPSLANNFSDDNGHRAPCHSMSPHLASL
jgi:hypothetical protein